MITRNKLEAYAHQIDPDWRNNSVGTVWYIFYKDNRYVAEWNSKVRILGTVYMSKSTAKQICEWLNDGRIEL